MTQDQEKASLTVDDILSIGRRAMDKCHGTESQHIYIAREVERRLQAAPAAVPAVQAKAESPGLLNEFDQLLQSAERAERYLASTPLPVASDVYSALSHACDQGRRVMADLIAETARTAAPQPAQVEEAPAPAPATETRLYRAAINCQHSIERDRIVLEFDPKQPGHNALNQLGRRLDAAVAAQAPAPAPETDDKPKSTAYERDLELLIHDFVRCSLVGTPSEATLHQLDRLIELVTHPTINRNLKSMRRQVTNPLPPCPPFASRRPSGAEIEAHEVQAAPQPEAQPQWRPIETAPKDGSMFMCWIMGVRYGETDEGQQYQEDISQVDFCWWRDNHGNGYFDPACGQIADSQDVTHWMPLPAAPSAQSEQGGKQ